MSSLSLDERFDAFEAVYLKFEGVAHPRSRRPDLHAFLLLEELQPGQNERDMISGAGHDVIYLDIEVDALNTVISDAQIEELVRCGVRCSDDGLEMFA